MEYKADFKEIFKGLSDEDDDRKLVMNEHVITYEADPDNGAVDILVDGETFITWSYEDDPEDAFCEFMSVYNLGGKHLEQQLTEAINDAYYSNMMASRLDVQLEELKANNARLREAIEYSTSYLNENSLNSIGSGSKAHNELEYALRETKQQSLAEIQAKAVEDAAEETAYEHEFEDSYMENRQTVAEYHTELICNKNALIECANQLRNQHKEGES